MNKLIQIGDLKVGGQRGRVFSTKGIIACISATDWKDAQKILTRRKLNDYQPDIADRKYNDNET